MAKRYLHFENNYSCKVETLMLRRNSFNKGEFLALFEMVAAVMVLFFRFGAFFSVPLIINQLIQPPPLTSNDFRNY